MEHGIQPYFLERARFQRRLSAITVAVAAAMLLGMVIARIPAMADLGRRIPVLRFGYEGPEQYVRRIVLTSRGVVTDAPQPSLQPTVITRTRRGGRIASKRTRAATALPEVVRNRTLGEGDSEVDAVARARALSANLPLVSSRDLIVEELVRPSYPEQARDHGIEGKVAVLALVDTTGHVVGVEVIGGASALQALEEAATEAVWRCRFRPYQVEGETRPVYAMFRFAFRIY